MLRKTSFVFLLMLSVSFFAQGAQAQDASPLDGTWLPATAELSGKMFPDEIRKTITLMIKGDTYKATVGTLVDLGTVKTNAAAQPKTIDITGTEGPNKGKTIMAIFEHDADTLRVCYDLSGTARPAAFETKEGTLLFLVTYKREKP